mmetsp:Transcript_39637/g.75859  ORF Transcript_39637/g.75859 Transcript_39637/m.75859 type:complete len:217 (-) Transcript_39637:537-1187(-)
MKTSFATALLAFFMWLFTSCTAAINLNETSDFQTCLRTPSSCTRLILDSNQMTGSLPSELGALSSLSYLHIGNNQFTGTVPTELGTLTSLTSLQCGGNQLTGTLPTELIALTRLTWMGFYNNQLTGTVMTELGIMTSLRRINLHHNQLTGSLPSELRALTSVNLVVWGHSCGRDLVLRHLLSNSNGRHPLGLSVPILHPNCRCWGAAAEGQLVPQA